MALTQLVDDTRRKAGVATAAGAIIERCESVLGAGFDKGMVDRCKVVWQLSFGLLELTLDPHEFPTEHDDSILNLDLRLGRVLFDRFEFAFQTHQLALQIVEIFEDFEDFIRQDAVGLGVGRKLVFNGLVFPIVRGPVEFALPLVKLGLVLTLLELLAVCIHPVFLDRLLASRHRIAGLLRSILSRLDLLGGPFDLPPDIGYLEQNLVKSTDNRIGYWHSGQTRKGAGLGRAFG